MKTGSDSTKQRSASAKREYFIREARVDDSARLATLLGELGYPASEQFARGRLARVTSTSEGLVLVADWDGEVAGVLAFQIIPLFHVAGDLGRITALVVSSRFERRGIGRQLVAAAERFGWERGCARIEITSGDHRPGAHAFYEAIGYRVDTRRFVKSRP